MEARSFASRRSPRGPGAAPPAGRAARVTKDELLSKVWPETCVEEGILTVHVSALRKAFGDDTRSSGYIETPADSTGRHRAAARGASWGSRRARRGIRTPGPGARSARSRARVPRRRSAVGHPARRSTVRRSAETDGPASGVRRRTAADGKCALRRLATGEPANWRTGERELDDLIHRRSPARRFQAHVFCDERLCGQCAFDD